MRQSRTETSRFQYGYGLDCADKNVYSGPGDRSGGETQSSEIGPNDENEIGTWKSRLKVHADKRTTETETGRINETALRPGSHAHENGHNGFHRLNRYDGIEIYRFGSITIRLAREKRSIFPIQKSSWTVRFESPADQWRKYGGAMRCYSTSQPNFKHPQIPWQCYLKMPIGLTT